MSEVVAVEEVDDGGKLSPKKRAQLVIDAYRDSIIRSNVRKLDLEKLITNAIEAAVAEAVTELKEAHKEAKKAWKLREKQESKGGNVDNPPFESPRVNLDDIFDVPVAIDGPILNTGYPKTVIANIIADFRMPEETVKPKTGRRGRPPGSKNKSK